MPFIRDSDEDRYYDEEELRQLKRGTGLFPPGFKGRGLYPPGHHQPAGYGYEISGEGVFDSLASLGKMISENKDLIKGVADAGTAVARTGSAVADTVKNVRQMVHGKKYSQPKDMRVSNPEAEKIDLEALKKLRQSAGLPVGSGFRFT